MDIESLSDSDLIKTSSDKNLDSSIRSKAASEYAKRNLKRNFISGSLVAWLSLILSIITFTITMLNTKKKTEVTCKLIVPENVEIYTKTNNDSLQNNNEKPLIG